LAFRTGNRSFLGRMAKVKLVSYAKQGEQPRTNSEGELVEFDIDYLVTCLAELRNTSYSVIEQPDRRKHCDHFYLIVGQQLVEVF